MKKSSSRPYKYEAIVGFGGNKGDVIKRFRQVLRVWLDDRRLKVVESSPILENPPFGYIYQAKFFNGVVKVKTSLDAKSFLRLLMHTEKRFKRERSFKNAPRTLDLDIITFSRFEQVSERLTIPHPSWGERVSVLAPLAWMERRCRKKMMG